MTKIGVQELLIVLAIVLVILGAGRLGKLGRDLGEGIREFQSAIAGGKDEPRVAE